MAHLDAALALAPDGEHWRAHADADHESISSMFGGWTAAVLLRSGVGDVGEYLHAGGYLPAE